MRNEDAKYYIALSLIPGVGSIIAKNIVSFVGSAEGVFKEKNITVQKIPKVGPFLAEAIKNADTLRNAELEIEFIEKHDIKAYIYNETDFPERLKLCEDAPIVLFVKGNCNLNAPKTIAIVGTRRATPYGKEICRKLGEGLRNHQATIVSGLAYGIDIQAHKAALSNDLETIAVLGHALNTIYPADHKAIAKQISTHGALVTEHCSHSPMDKSNFVKRNRIIAGLSDATIIVESGEKGGALITAEYAQSYNRDVFAFPGKTTDTFSKGCNKLIKTNKAAMVESIEDIEYQLNWLINDKKHGHGIQKKLFIDLSPDEEHVRSILHSEDNLNIDVICSRSNLPMNKVSVILFNLECIGMVKCLPGNMYHICL